VSGGTAAGLFQPRWIQATCPAEEWILPTNHKRVQWRESQCDERRRTSGCSLPPPERRWSFGRPRDNTPEHLARPPGSRVEARTSLSESQRVAVLMHRCAWRSGDVPPLVPANFRNASGYTDASSAIFGKSAAHQLAQRCRIRENPLALPLASLMPTAAGHIQ
jgi:hypothetical protein